MKTFTTDKGCTTRDALITQLLLISVSLSNTCKTIEVLIEPETSSSSKEEEELQGLCIAVMRIKKAISRELDILMHDTSEGEPKLSLVVSKKT